MRRLSSEWQRLYAADAQGSLINGSGQVRALVLQLARPADWRAVSRVWEGVQTELNLPAPAIAVNGRDGYQLWFSLEQAVPAAEARAFLADLQTRYLAEVPAERLDLWPRLDTLAPEGIQHTTLLPDPHGQAVAPEQWSAFLAPDLAPVFQDTPWLDLPPNLEGQADLLSHQRCIKPADWRRLCAPGLTSTLPEPPARVDRATDPRQFLLSVMNNDHIDMALRIEAAKALLPYPHHP